MPVIDLNLEGDNAWPDLHDRDEDVVHLPDVTWRLAAFQGGMSTGRPSLALRIDLHEELGHAPAGVSVVITETSLAAWIAATCALRGRFPEAFQGTPLAAP